MEDQTNHAERTNHAYLVFMLSLSLFALGATALELTNIIAPESKEILRYADKFVCALFFLDFLHLLARAKDRTRYLFTWGLLDLASSIPMVDALRWTRAARVMRIFRVLRCVRSARIMVQLLVEKRVQSTALAAGLLVTILVTVSSISVLHFEAGYADAKITTARDAIWWAIYTMLTIGCDKVPVTSEGLALGAVLGFLGLGILGTFSGFVAYWFLGSGDAETATKLDDVKRELVEIKELVRGGTRDRKSTGDDRGLSNRG